MNFQALYLMDLSFYSTSVRSPCVTLSLSIIHSPSISRRLLSLLLTIHIFCRSFFSFFSFCIVWHFGASDCNVCLRFMD